jgi:hypothetical protein
MAVRVLFLSLEISERTIQTRYQKMNCPVLDGVDFAFNWAQGPEALADIEVAIESGAYGLVIVDMAPKIRATGSDWNDYGAAYDAFGPIRELAKRLDVCVLLLAHNSKAEGRSATDSILGSVGFVATCDVILGLNRPLGNDKASLVVAGNDVEYREIALGFRSAPLGFVVIDENPREARLTPERRAILTVVREAGEDGIKTAAIAEIVGRELSSVSRDLGKLKGEGLIFAASYGRYRAQSCQTCKSTDLDMVPRGGRV